MKALRLLLLVVFFLACHRGEPSLFQPLRPALKTIPEGMELMILEDHELPTAQLFLSIRGGSVYDPPGKEGLHAIAMQAVRTGGTELAPPDRIDEELESVGAALEMGTQQEYNQAQLSLHRKDLDRGLDILFDLLRRPALAPERFELVKARMKEGLIREREDPLALGYREFPPFVYGPKAPWGRQPTPESIEKVTLDDVRHFVRTFLRPDRILLAAAGDFLVDELKLRVEERCRGWERSISALPEIPPLKEDFQPGVVLMPRKGLTQSTILIGHLGAKRENPDKYPLLVMNFILGGGGSLTSRLGEVIRSSEGKAYAVWSDFGFGKDVGIFRATAQTALANTDWVIAKIREMIGRLASSPDFTDAEIGRAKQAILRSLIFKYETRFEQVKEQARFRLWGYPEDYITTFQKGISKVTRRDLERVARTYLHPEGLKVLVVTAQGRFLSTMENVEIRRIE